MATKFEISQQSLIKKYENLNTYFKNWNVSEAYVKSHSTPQNLRSNTVKASWGRYYGNDDSGITLIVDIINNKGERKNEEKTI